VAILARNRERLDDAARAIAVRPHLGGAPSVVPLSCDTGKADEIARAVDRVQGEFRRIDILVNCAGAARAGTFLDLTDEAYVDAWTVKVLGYIRMVRAVVPQMIAQRDGRIVNIVGGAARTPTPTFLPGSTANAALINFTRGISRWLATHNVRIAAISPGSTATERAERLAGQEAAARGMSLEQVKAERRGGIPLGHMVDPAEIAAMTLLVVSDRVASLTGTEIQIDGGTTRGV